MSGKKKIDIVMWTWKNNLLKCLNNVILNPLILSVFPYISLFFIKYYGRENVSKDMSDNKKNIFTHSYSSISAHPEYFRSFAEKMYRREDERVLLLLLISFLLMSSTTLTLSAEQIQIHTRAQQERKTEPITVNFYAQKNRVVVGQELVCSLTVTYDPRRVSIRGLELPKYDDQVFQESVQGPVREQVEVSGQQLARLSWTVKLYPRKAGPVRLPGITVQYGMIDNQRGSFGDMFMWAFSQDNRLYTLTSKDLLVTVDPVPATGSAGLINAVGQYNSCLVSVDRATIKQGEAITLSIALKGTGNAGFEQSLSPELPAGLICYPESTKRTEHGAVSTFAVQCNRAGAVQIPAQKFTCYNPVTKKIDTLTSRPIGLTVSPDEKNSLAGESLTQTEQEPEADQSPELPPPANKTAIPYRAILFFCFIVLVGFVCWYLRKTIGQISSRFLYICWRKADLIRLSFAARRGKLLAGDAYMFLSSYANCQSTDSDWQDFWLSLQAYYFRGRPGTLLSRAESDQVRFWAKRLKKNLGPVCSRRLYSIFVIFVLAIVIIGLSVFGFIYQRSGVTRRLLVDTPLYLGPGSGYPVSRELVAGELVRVMYSAPERADLWKFVDAHGEKGWLPHDVVV